FGSVLIDEPLLTARKPRLHRRLDITFLDIFETESAETKLLDDVAPIIVSNRGQLKFRAPFRQQIHSQYPLLDGVVPSRQLQPSRQNLLGKQPRRSIRRRRFDPFRFEHEITKEHHFNSLYSSRRGIKRGSYLRAHFVREQFAQQICFDRRGERQNSVVSPRPPADLMNFSRDEKRTSPRSAFARQRASPAVDEIAAQRGFIHSCDAIAEADHDALSKRFIIDDAAGLRGFHIQLFVPSNTQELLMQRADLPRRYAVDTHLAQDVDAKFIFQGEPPCAHENPKIRCVFGAKELSA